MEGSVVFKGGEADESVQSINGQPAALGVES